MSEQLDWLLTPTFKGYTLQRMPHFDGKTYEPEHDHKRLGKQMQAVKMLMSDGRFRTLLAISRITGYPEASVSARLRDLRKAKFGGYTIERRSIGERKNGLFDYRMVKS